MRVSEFSVKEEEKEDQKLRQELPAVEVEMVQIDVEEENKQAYDTNAALKEREIVVQP